MDLKDNTLHLRTTNETIEMEETSAEHLVINSAKNVDKDKEEAVNKLFFRRGKKGIPH